MSAHTSAAIGHPGSGILSLALTSLIVLTGAGLPPVGAVWATDGDQSATASSDPAPAADPTKEPAADPEPTKPPSRIPTRR